MVNRQKNLYLVKFSRCSTELSVTRNTGRITVSLKSKLNYNPQVFNELVTGKIFTLFIPSGNCSSSEPLGPTFLIPTPTVLRLTNNNSK